MASSLGLNLGVGSGRGASVPAWVVSGARYDLDFANGRYYGDTLAHLVACTRASSGTDLLPSSASGASYNTFLSNVLRITSGAGLLVEGAATNQLLNSTVPATQTTGSLGTGTYTLWVNGSGSAAVTAGTATITGGGTATNGSPNTFTVTGAGTVTVTVTGSLNAFQLEAGAFGTSLVITAGATASRVADVIQLSGGAATLMQGSAYSVYAKTNLAQNQASSGRIIGTDGGGAEAVLYTPASTTTVGTYDGSSVRSATLGSGTTAGVVKSAAGFSGTGRSIVGNNGTVATDASVMPALVTAFLGSNNGGNNFLDGYIQEVALWTSRQSDVALKGFTV